MFKTISFWFAQSFLMTTVYPALIAAISPAALVIGMVLFVCNIWVIYKYFDRPFV